MKEAVTHFVTHLTEPSQLSGRASKADLRRRIATLEEMLLLAAEDHWPHNEGDDLAHKQKWLADLRARSA